MSGREESRPGRSFSSSALLARRGVSRADGGARGEGPSIGAVALLELLSGPAGAGIVAADFRRVSMDRLDLRVLSPRSRGAVGVIHVGGAAGRKRDGSAALRRSFGASLADDRL